MQYLDVYRQYLNDATIDEVVGNTYVQEFLGVMQYGSIYRDYLNDGA